MSAGLKENGVALLGGLAGVYVALLEEVCQQ